jgi:hypothetical protein
MLDFIFLQCYYLIVRSIYFYYKILVMSYPRTGTNKKARNPLRRLRLLPRLLYPATPQAHMRMPHPARAAAPRADGNIASSSLPEAAARRCGSQPCQWLRAVGRTTRRRRQQRLGHERARAGSASERPPSSSSTPLGMGSLKSTCTPSSSTSPQFSH